MLEIVMPELRAVAKDFYRLTGIKIVLYDETQTILFSHPDHMCDFCKIVRQCSALTESCFACDRVGFEHCKQNKRPYIYRCHMGLAEAIMPICERDTVIGYMMMGQILCEGEREQAEHAARSAARANGLDADRMIDALASLRGVSDDFIRAALSMMSMCVCYLYSNRIIQSRSVDLPLQLRKYVENHFANRLSVSSLCRQFYLSKTKLYEISQAEFGMGISDYIRQRRIEEALRLLSTTEKKISQVAAEVGFQNANYFTRAFRREVGLTPGQYRLAHSKGTDKESATTPL